jgi:dienelactone hydrolase
MRGTQHGGIDVGFMAHPSFVTEDELRAMRGPLSIAAPETDLIFTAEKRRRTEEILKEKGEVFSISLYGRVAHGFAVRGDWGNPIDTWAEGEAFAQAVRFFDSWVPS